ncbi:MAG: hypothetical protein IJM54_04260, partial [Thermoguttaceae bacterium]|nr:hypothetical protein [Thermoguttaceae bacterium]
KGRFFNRKKSFFLPKSYRNVELGRMICLGCKWPKGIRFGDLHSFFMGTFWRFRFLKTQMKSVSTDIRQTTRPPGSAGQVRRAL